MRITHKTIGIGLIVIAIALLVLISFLKTNVDENLAKLCDLTHEQHLAQEGDCPYHTSSSSWMIMLAFGIAFLIGGVGVFLAVYEKPAVVPHPAVQQSFRHIDPSTLSPEEQQIYSLVKQKQGSAYQSDIIKETGFSKVKMTRLLDKLETNQIIERKRRGMTNIIVLK